MENPVTKVIHIQEFDFKQWLEDLKRFENEIEFREQAGYHAVELERGFYYVLANVKDLTFAKEILKYYICGERDLRFHNIANLIQKNKKLVLDYYMMVSNDAEMFTDETNMLQMALQSHANDRQAFCTELQNCSEPQIILKEILKHEELAWRLTVFRTDYLMNVDMKTNLIEEIISKSYSSLGDYTDQIKYLEKLGADTAFYARTLTTEMAAIFMSPLRGDFHNGWHYNYCENLFTRLIYPILNVIEQEPNIDQDAFVNLMLCILEHYPIAKKVLTITPNQRLTIFKLIERNYDDNQRPGFLARLERLGVN